MKNNQPVLMTPVYWNNHCIGTVDSFRYDRVRSLYGGQMEFHAQDFHGQWKFVLFPSSINSFPGWSLPIFCLECPGDEYKKLLDVDDYLNVGKRLNEVLEWYEQTSRYLVMDIRERDVYRIGKKNLL